MAQVRLVVGLGNPGLKYRETRHNLGFMVADLVVSRAGARFTSGKGGWDEIRVALADRPIWAIKPLAFMNLSGQAVRAFSAYYGIAPEETLVVCDDINLPLGKLRIRAGGSEGGHKGLASIIESLGTDQFPRLRLGIGLPPEGQLSEDYVLERFRAEERSIVAEMVTQAAEAVALIVGEGLEAAQMKYN